MITSSKFFNKFTIDQNELDNKKNANSYLCYLNKSKK